MAIHFHGLDVGGASNLAEVLEASPDCVKILDLLGRILAINSAGAQFLDQPSSALEGRFWIEFLPRWTAPCRAPPCGYPRHVTRPGVRKPMVAGRG